jgi:hypothetical protein
MRRTSRLLSSLTLTLVLAATLVLAPSGRVRACPNCKEAVAAQPHEVARAADGYNWSVLFMLAMPFTLFGTGAWMVARAVKRGVLPEM